MSGVPSRTIQRVAIRLATPLTQGSKYVDRIGSDRDPDRGSPIRVERDPGNFGFTRARVDLDPENFLITRARADLDREFFLCPISQIIFMP